MEDLALFFKGMTSLEIIDVSDNIHVDRRKPFKYEEAMLHLIKGLRHCKSNLTWVNISSNQGINGAKSFVEFKKLITESKKLRTLNISTLGMSKKNCKAFVKFLSDQMNNGWNLDNNLKELIWNDDLKKSPSTTLKLLTKDIPSVYNMKLTKLSMCGCLKSEPNRVKVSKALKQLIPETVFEYPDDPNKDSKKEYASDKE